MVAVQATDARRRTTSRGLLILLGLCLLHPADANCDARVRRNDIIRLDFKRGVQKNEFANDLSSQHCLELLSIPGIKNNREGEAQLPAIVAAGEQIEFALGEELLRMCVAFDVKRGTGIVRFRLLSGIGRKRSLVSIPKLTSSAKRITLRRKRNQERLENLERRKKQIAKALPKLRARCAATKPITPARLMLLQQINNLTQELKGIPPKVGRLRVEIAIGTRALERVRSQLAFLQRLAESRASVRYRLVSVGEASDQEPNRRPTADVTATRAGYRRTKGQLAAPPLLAALDPPRGWPVENTGPW